jgi:hypothetical protein
MGGYLLFEASSLFFKCLSDQDPLRHFPIGLRVFGRAHVFVHLRKA